MKILVILALLCLDALCAEEIATSRATLLASIIIEPVTQPVPVSVLRLDISEENILKSNEIIADGQKITVQEIVPITLPPLLPAPEPRILTAAQIASRDARLARGPRHRCLMLSCTVFNNKHTRIQGTTRIHNTTERWEAWSNINFHHFNRLPRFRKNDTIYSPFFGIGDENTTRAAARLSRVGKAYIPPAIPELPADPTTEPRFVVTNGNPTAEDLAPLIGFHEIYQDHHKDLISEYTRIKAIQEKQAADRLANPPDPKPDIVIQHWTVTPDAPPAPTKLIHSETNTSEASTLNAEKATR